jgi:hypothetical protein
MRGFVSLALFLICGLAHLALAQEAITGYEGASANPQTPGYHKLVYHYTDEGKPYQLSFLLYLPQAYAGQIATPPASQPSPAPAETFPMLVFMSGLGERGSDPQMLFASGVTHDLAERPDVMKWLPMIMVGPQCPADARYEDARIGKAITGIIDEISRRYRVDAQRRYITGFSMGGTGCWSVARFARERLAVVAPVVPRVFEPQALGSALAGTGTTCLVISGEVDAKSEPGSAEMVKTLRGRGVDVVYAMIPKGDHYLWPWYYHDKRFYEWLLSHRQGSPKPADRLGEPAIIEMARERATSNSQYLARMDQELQQFARWWQIDNCSVWGDQGLRKELFGRHGVFVTLPYYYEVPCRLQRTTTMATADKVTLHLVVGHHPEGDWKLIVRVNEQEVYKSPIDKTTAPDLWKTIDIDLTPWSGQEVRLQLCHAAYNEMKNEQALWESIKILPEPVK